MLILLHHTQVYSLEAFQEQHSQQVQRCAERFAYFSEAAFDIVQAACRDDLVHLQQHLETFNVSRADSTATTATATSPSSSSSHPTLPLQSPGHGATGSGGTTTSSSSRGHISITELLKTRSTVNRHQQTFSNTATASSGKAGDAKSAQQVRV